MASLLTTQALYKESQFDADTSLAYLLHLSMHSVKSQVECEMGAHDLTAMQWQPLYMIAIGRATTAAGLARLMQVDTGAVTRMLDRLQAKGLVQRERNANDRRVVNLELTAAGRERAKAVPAVLCDVLNSHLNGFSKAEHETLKTLLQRMIENGREITNE